MDELTNAGHPSAEELQAHADGEVHDERVATHVQSCEACRGEVAAVRRVSAALALGTKSPDTLLTRIQAKRAEAARAPTKIRTRSRYRAFAVPIGLAAAAALLVFAPRAFREEPADNPVVGAKGALGGTLFETQLTEWTIPRLDSAVAAASGRRVTTTLRYAAGVSGSGEAEALAGRIRAYLSAQGMDPAAIEVSGVPSQSSTWRIPSGAVHISVRAR